MNIVDFIPHGMVVAFGGVVSYIYRDHVKQDDARFGDIKQELQNIYSRQTEISDKMGENHAEILRVLLTAEQQRAANAAIEKR
jgi:hypothetical protein